MDMEGEESCKRIVMIPLPAQGHQNPMMHLASRLAILGGIHITIFVNNWYLSSALAFREKSLEHLIEIKGIEEGCVPKEYMKGNSQATQKLLQAATLMEEPIERALTEQEGICCIISDAILDWPQNIANKLKIPKVGVWTSGTTCAVMMASIDKLMEEGWLPVQEKIVKFGNMEIEGIQGIKWNIKDMPYTFLQADEDGLRMRAYKFRKMMEYDYILLNTFEPLDNEMVQVLQSMVPCYQVGPLLPTSMDEPIERNNQVVKVGDLEEDRTCLSWLDRQEVSSVLYISFGSLANVSLVQVEELALGLEASMVTFLWVVRPSLVDGLNESSTFKGFLDRISGGNKGLLVEWAPQLEVLAHTSICMFLSHCGWNSTIESIWNGVPLLTLPCFAEQNTNARLVVSKWKIGAALRFYPDDTIQRNDVENGITSAMKDQAIRNNMLILRDAARKAVKQGGSSAKNLLSFVTTVLR